MAGKSTKVAVLLFVFLQVSCAVSQLVNIPAVMTVNGFEDGEGGGGPAACDGQNHTDAEFVVSLSSQWFDVGARCGKTIRMQNSANINTLATVVDECVDCDNEVGASAICWLNFQLDPSLGEVSIIWADVN